MPQFEVSPLAPPTNDSGFPSLSYILAGAVFLLVTFTLSLRRKKSVPSLYFRKRSLRWFFMLIKSWREGLQARRAIPRNAVAAGNGEELQPVVVIPVIAINDDTHLHPGGVGVGLGTGPRVTAHPYTFVDFNGAAAHATTSTSTISRPPPAALIHADTQHAEPAAPIADPNTTHSHPPRSNHRRPRRPKPPASLADSSASRPRPARRQHERPHGSELTPSLTHPNTPPHRISAPRPQHRHGQSPAGLLGQVNDMAETVGELMRITADEEDLFNQ